MRLNCLSVNTLNCSRSQVILGGLGGLGSLPGGWFD
jgi:hypothetical protein